MSKLKFLNLFLEPLYLKFRGRIVGDFSKITMAICIGFGLFSVVSITLLIIFSNLEKNSGVVVKPENKIEEKLVTPVQDQTAASVVLPIPIPKVVAQEKEEKKEEKQEQEKEIRVAPKPIKGQIQLDFGWQNHPVYNDWRYHTGIDIKGDRGQVVQAIYKGQVVDIFRDQYSGLTVVVKDNTYHIYYGSLSEVTVEQGSVVSANQVIGKMGSCTAEPYDHLHLAIKKDQQYIDPKLIVPVG